MKTENTIRVILADDHARIRRGIRRMLEKDSAILVIGESGTGLGAIDLVHELRPDILLLDMEMPDMKGYHVAQALRTSRVPITILALSACNDDYFIQAAMQAGMDGYLHKSEAPAKLRELIRCLYERPVIVEL